MGKIYEFGSGRPDPGSIPIQGLVEAAARAIPRIGGDFALYPGDKGYQGLREVAAARFKHRESIELPVESITLTNGSMQGITLVAEAFAEPGDVVITEEFTYSGTLGVFRNRGLRIVGVPLDEHGMRMDALEEALKEWTDRGQKPKFIYPLVTYQNPTGSVMPLSRRKELLALAREYDVLVIDDNCYGDVRFEGEPPPALYTLDDVDSVVYLASLSKILSPAIRLGYLIAPEPLMSRALGKRWDGGISTLSASIVAEYFRENLWSHVEEINAIVKKKRDTLFGALEEHLGGSASWSHPVGGLFLWLKLPEDTDLGKLSQLAQEKGVLYASGRSFHCYNEEVPHLRLAFGYPSLDEIKEGIALLATCIQQAQAAPVAAG